MKLRGALVALVAGGGFLLAGCGSSPASSTVRACNLLASAEDGMNDATNAYIAMGKPSGGTQAARDALANYPVLISQAADEALSGPADLSASFQQAATNARLYQQALNANMGSSAGVFSLAINDTIQKCKDAGVDMQISDVVTE